MPLNHILLERIIWRQVVTTAKPPDRVIRVFTGPRFVGDKESDFCFSVKDYGEGFDFNQLPDPTAPENIEKENGRGIYLMKSLSEEVEFNNGGTEVDIYFTKK